MSDVEHESGRTTLLRLAAVVLLLEVLAVVAATLAGVSFDLTGGPFLGLVVGFTLTVDAVVALAWNRWPRRARTAGRVLGILAISVVGAATAMTYLNRQEGFYASFSDLLGSAPRQPRAPVSYRTDPVHARLDVLTPDWQRSGAAAAARGQGSVLSVRIWGSRSHIDREGLVYLPAAYFVGSAQLRFPVMELLHGQPGGPANLTRQLAIASVLDREIREQRIAPLIAVLPDEESHGVFTECVNAVHGQQNDTYLTVDTVDDVSAAFRVLPGRTWGIAGYSTGGFCAVNLAGRHPDIYSAAASLSGYFVPAQDHDTSRLYAGSKAALRANSPTWWATHRAPVSPPLYVFASGQDPFALTQARQFQRVVERHAPALPTRFVYAATGGHNWTVWNAAMPAALEWVATYLPAPLVR